MLKFVFWILVALNALVFAFGQGYLGKFKGNEREPARMQHQLAAEKLTLLPMPPGAVPASAPAGTTDSAPGTPAAPAASAASTASTASTAPAAPAAAPASPAAPLLACTEVGSFSAGAARRFETRLARLDLGEHQSRVEVQEQDVKSYLVHIPPLGSKEAAERKTAELRERGVTNSFIMSGDSPLKWAISLGVFKSEAMAQTLVAALNKQGVHSARIFPRGPQVTRFAYQFRGIDAATRAKIAGIADAFDSAQVKSCR